eukprot:3257244-Prymnesium_polylepis.1
MDKWMNGVVSACGGPYSTLFNSQRTVSAGPSSVRAVDITTHQIRDSLYSCNSPDHIGLVHVYVVSAADEGGGKS